MSNLAHGVGRVYESPIPVSLYLAAAAATVIASFVIQAFRPSDRPKRPRVIGGESAGGAVLSVVRTYLLVVFGLVLILALVYTDQGGLNIPALMFWVAFVITSIVLCCLVGGLWPAASPVETIDTLLRSQQDSDDSGRSVPVWLPPFLIYLLFWFELVSGRGFDSIWILGFVLAYLVYVISVKPVFGHNLPDAEPFGVLLGFAQRVAPFRIADGRLTYRGFVSGLDENEPMPAGLFAALFVLLASTTLDNLRETTQWFDLLDAMGLDTASDLLVDSVALVGLTIPFVLPFFLAVSASPRGRSRERNLMATARHFGWSLIPIGIAYVLAHNITLLIVGFPSLVNQLTENFGMRPFGGYTPSPALAWVLEIGLIVGGHMVGVMAAQRAAVRLAGSHRVAIKSHAALTALMSLYTASTLWLLSLPLVTTQ